jgi:hypothetical protein
MLSLFGTLNCRFLFVSNHIKDVISLAQPQQCNILRCHQAAWRALMTHPGW